MSGATRFIIRPWRDADKAAVAEIFARAVREVASRDYRPAQIEAWASGARDLHENSPNRLRFVAEEAGNCLIGFAQYEPPDHVDMVYVHPARLRRGIARALLATIEAEAKRRNAPALDLEASITGRPFFERCGFAVLTPQIVRARGQDFLNYRMRKALR